MKKIRFNDMTEMEVYNISDNKNTLQISMLNADANATEQIFADKEKTAVIQYFVGTDLIKGFAGYTQLQGYAKKMNQTMNINYATPDASTESGFAEEVADILAVTLIKPERIVAVAEQAEQNTANIDYVAMETGVEL